jgi:hypothetical protein
MCSVLEAGLQQRHLTVMSCTLDNLLYAGTFVHLQHLAEADSIFRQTVIICNNDTWTTPVMGCILTHNLLLKNIWST